VLVALTWIEILSARSDRVVVIDGRHKREAIIRFYAHADTRRGERIDWTSEGKVVGAQRRPTEGRGNESAGAVGEHKLGVGSQFTKTDRKFFVKQALLEPHLIQPGRGEGNGLKIVVSQDGVA